MTSAPTPAGAPILAPAETALFTDLYELTMMRAYDALGIEAEAVFSLFVRRLPPSRPYLLAAGLEPLLEQIAALRFDGAALDYLASLDGRFPDPFLKRLESFRFSGAVRAVPEGTLLFPHEPLLEVRAPLFEGQLLETLIMNQIGLSTLLATKAARVVRAAAGRPVLDFGSRRAQGIDAALSGARAFSIAGVAGTSNVLAGQRYGIPVAGTMAHSFVTAFPSETAAFEAFAGLYPGSVVLIDTYDVLEGARRAAALMTAGRAQFSAVRIDSGDLAALSRAVRALLDAEGLGQVKIVVSGGLTERRIAELLASGAPIDGFGVGTEMSTAGDAPSLDIVYKLTELGGEGRVKLAAGKNTWPMAKQVFRESAADGAWTGDVIARADEALPGAPLLETVMAGGARVRAAEPLGALRARAAASLDAAPAALHALDVPKPPYAARFSDALEADFAAAEARVAAQAKA